MHKSKRYSDMNGSSISTASSIHARLADAASKEFFWGCELSKEKPSVTWTFEEEEDDQDFLQHTLFLRHATLGKGATKDEQNLIEIETKNFAGDEIKQPLFTLTCGKLDMCQLDLNFGHEIPVTFRLIEGTGPVFLSAQQLVEFPQEIEEDEFLTGTETETECDEEELEAEAEELISKSKKRKSNGVSGSKKKRGKMDTEANTTGTEDDDDEEDEEEEEEEEEEESMETSEDPEEEDEDEDDDDDDEDYDEDEEDSPKKKKGKAKKGKAAPVPVTKKAKAVPKPKKGGRKAKAK